MKSADKFNHPDFVGGIVWSEIELDWIRNRDKEWEQQLATQAEQINAAREALAGVIAWDKRRGFPIPYKVRDPVHFALAKLEVK